MTSPQLLMTELTHRIHSPLAAIRNALYLAGCRTDDAQLHAYLKIADSEVTSIVRALCAAREAAREAARDYPAPFPEGLNDQPLARSAAAGHITGITAHGCS